MANNGKRPWPPGRPRGQVWKDRIPLFPPVSRETKEVLEYFPELLAQVWPLNRAHRQSLPEDICGLSRLLTSERARLSQPYWSRPGFISAYLYYFLPWNILRLCRLLRGLELPAPPASAGGIPLLLDAGSGPLTLPLALWLAKPQWRGLPIHVLALDTSRQPLQLGRQLFQALGQRMRLPVWQSHLATGPMRGLARHAQSLRIPGLEPFLVCAANVLNEARDFKRGRRGGAVEEPEFCGSPDSGEAWEENGRMENYCDELLEAWEPVWAKSASLLLVEPGTRLGGSAIMQFRQSALDYGLAPAAPCTHQRPCPLRQNSDSSRLASSWCHFVFDAEGAPDWLVHLSREAGLAKQSLSLSPLLLEQEEKARPKNCRENLPARVISDAFPIPGGKGRYACCDAGKCLLENAESLPAGALVHGFLAQKPRLDAKSGAPILEALKEEAKPVQRHEKARPQAKRQAGKRLPEPGPAQDFSGKARKSK